MIIIAPDREANTDIFPIFFTMKVYCVFTLESPQLGDSNEHTQYTIFDMKKEHHTVPILQLWNFFPKDSRTCSKEPGKRAISVQAIEVLLY